MSGRTTGAPWTGLPARGSLLYFGPPISIFFFSPRIVNISLTCFVPRGVFNVSPPCKFPARRNREKDRASDAPGAPALCGTVVGEIPRLPRER